MDNHRSCLILALHGGSENRVPDGGHDLRMARQRKSGLEDRYWRFIHLIVDAGVVWVLIKRSTRGGAWVESQRYVTEDDGPLSVHLVFSTEARAKRLARGKWADYVTATVELDVFVSRMLPQIHARGELLGPDYRPDLRGLEVEPSRIASDIRATAETR